MGAVRVTWRSRLPRNRCTFIFTIEHTNNILETPRSVAVVFGSRISLRVKGSSESARIVGPFVRSVHRVVRDVLHILNGLDYDPIRVLWECVARKVW